MDEKRNVLVESARYLVYSCLSCRIARSNILDLSNLDVSKYDVHVRSMLT